MTETGDHIFISKIMCYRFKIFVKLFIVMGFCYIPNLIYLFITDRKSNVAAFYPFQVISLLQGVLIFMAYVCNMKTLKLIMNKFGYER